jgi:hypothetical protein
MRDEGGIMAQIPTASKRRGYPAPHHNSAKKAITAAATTATMNPTNNSLGIGGGVQLQGIGRNVTRRINHHHP